MDSYTTNNGNSTTNSNSNINRPHKSRSNTFSQAAVTKQDVGEFQSGYFVMVDNTPATNQQQRPKTHKTPERILTRKGEQQTQHQQQRPRTSSNKDIDQQQLQQQREGDMHVSPGRLTTSPHRSPTRNKRSPIPQAHQSEPSVPTSPHKPRKAHHMDGGSPPKDKPSPATNRWAGPAFTNAPPPSSLPLPDFPPFITPLPSQPSSSTNSSPSSSPPPSSPAMMFAPPTMYHENIYIQPPLNVAQQQPQFSYQFFYADAPSQPTYAEQLSTDLRKMLHIGQPISA